jgi:1-aminocyclopropane-1-carboxylate deaminase/D-cysteine desulfhydrase-like pyridoxal-dependent ACC family enzyme
VAVSPRVPLATLPTPLQRAHRLERALGSPPILVKRDDLTGFALAGNKARKLEYLLGEARARGADVLVTGGGVRSNHCRGAAAAARVAGLEAVIVCYGGEPADPPANLRLMRGFGADVRWTGDPDRPSVDAALEEVVARLEAAGRTPYVVPRGGATAVGARGYADAALELTAQTEAVGLRPTVVVVATGSGGTQAGLVAGTVAAGRPWRVVGASVSRPVEEVRDRILRLALDCADLIEGPQPEDDDVEVVEAIGPGYGAPSTEGSEATRLAAETEGLLLDPTFTAKGMATLIRLAREGLPGPAVFLHTGGTGEAVDRAGTRPEEGASDG